MFFAIALIASFAALVAAWIVKESADDGTIDELLPRSVSDKVYQIASYATLAALLSTVLSTAGLLICFFCCACYRITQNNR